MIKIYNELFGLNCLVVSVIMDKRKGNLKIYKSKC